MSKIKTNKEDFIDKMDRVVFCDNTNCVTLGKKQKLVLTTLTDDFNGDQCLWCKDCRERDKEMIIETKPREPKIKEIVVPVYFSYDENDKILIDSEGMKDEFEMKLEKLENELEEK